MYACAYVDISACIHRPVLVGGIPMGSIKVYNGLREHMREHRRAWGAIWIYAFSGHSWITVKSIDYNFGCAVIILTFLAL